MQAAYKLSGYHRLARLMGCSNDIAIFRKFNDLNMLNLLSLQAELSDLRQEFYSICEDDDRRGESFSRSFASLAESKNAPNNFQYEKLNEIRSKLKEYNEFLLQAARVNKLGSPTKGNLSILQEYLRDPKGGNLFLQDVEAFTWRQEHEEDLVTFQLDRPDQDFFTTWLTTHPVRLYHKLMGHKTWRPAGQLIDEEAGVVRYKEGRLEKCAKLISITLASTVPMVTILGLYFERDLLKRIYISIGITAAFAALLSIFTNARRIEIFAATASLAAVEVVFIGSADI